MNEQLQQALVAILGKATSGLEAGVDFLGAQLPDVVYQLLMWHAVGAVFWAAFKIGLVVLGIICVRRAIKQYTAQQVLKITANDAESLQRYQDYGKPEYLERRQEILDARNAFVSNETRCRVALVLALVTGVCGFVAFWCVPYEIGTALQIWLAPKLYLIEYAASLVK